MADWTVTVRPNTTNPTRTDIAGALAVGLVGVGLVWIGGFAGLLATLVTVAVWAVIAPEYAVAAGQVLVAALVGAAGPVAIPPIVVAESGLALVLLVELLADDDRRFGVLGYLVAIGGIGAVTSLLYATEVGLWLVGGVQLAVFAVAAYGIHRYERLRLGLIEGPTGERA